MPSGENPNSWNHFKGSRPSKNRGLESIKDSFSKVRAVPMKMDEQGRATLDYSKLAKKRMTINDMMHLKLMQDYLKAGGPDEYKMYLDTVKTYYPQHKIKEVIIEKLPQQQQPPAPIAPERVSEILGGGDFNPAEYTDEQLQALLTIMEDMENGKGNIDESEENVRAPGD